MFSYLFDNVSKLLLCQISGENLEFKVILM
jgi:hypothetical protein